MQAFGSYGKETIIDFERVNQNLFLVTGDTGSGKTTIFDAIVFALFGEASSSANKKEGVVLQSQYVDYTCEPVVELTFSEGQGEEKEIYTVRRVPRHLKTITRGSAKGKQREITGSVSLILPDGIEYPPKETDKKIQEIIGLTKGQFMQVAMIAQGEFMELLRAKSDDKKVIFRKLFNTELYQEIVNELGNRKKEKDKEIAVLKTQCQSEAARIRVPETYVDCEEILRLKNEIESGQMALAGELLEALDRLCRWLKNEKEHAEKGYKEAEQSRINKQEELTRAEEILKWFEQLETAEKELEICLQKQDEMEENKRLAEAIRGAYEIREKYQQFQDMQKTLTDTSNVLEKLQNELPRFIEGNKDAEIKADAACRLKDAELENYSKCEENVRKAMESFGKIKAKETEKKTAFMEERKAAEQTAHNEKMFAVFEEEELRWKRENEELADADKNLTKWEAKKQEAVNLQQELGYVQEQGRQAKECLEKAKTKRDIYGQVSGEYQGLHKKYEEIRQSFLDEQAGILAGELKTGEPCPVCGSTEHPHPFRSKVEHVDISPEKLEEMRIDVEKLREKQEKAASESSSAKAEYETRKTAYIEAVGKLQNRMKTDIPEINEKSGPTEMGERLNLWKEIVTGNVNKHKEDAEKLKKVREQLQTADEQKKKLQENLEYCRNEWKDKTAKLAAITAELESLRMGVGFETEEAAKNVLAEAEVKKKKAEELYETANGFLKEIQKKVHNAETLIEKYQNEIPVQTELMMQKKEVYEKVLLAKKQTEESWKWLVEKYAYTEEQKLLNLVAEYKEKLTAANTQMFSAKNAIGSKEKPVLEDLRKEYADSEKKYEEAKTVFYQCRQDMENDEEIFCSLEARMDDRKTVLAEHARLETLYRMTSGNISGARMDLETYVQRYYLERILFAANRRFQEMSAGQFELRMYDLEKAGEGKNKGLDLMVYSTITGKEREVRTLSGGESFMAALSLALGMADQIQESSGALHLDMMFIDEGFGSLDEHSRNQAVRVLKEMSEGSRLIGIISHVTELKQEIEDQLLVTKDENGSHVKWQIS